MVCFRCQDDDKTEYLRCKSLMIYDRCISNERRNFRMNQYEKNTWRHFVFSSSQCIYSRKEYSQDEINFLSFFSRLHVLFSFVIFFFSSFSQIANTLAYKINVSYILGSRSCTSSYDHEGERRKKRMNDTFVIRYYSH